MRAEALFRENGGRLRESLFGNSDTFVEGGALFDALVRGLNDDDDRARDHLMSHQKRKPLAPKNGVSLSSVSSSKEATLTLNLCI